MEAYQCMAVQMLHIGKTGGSALGGALSSLKRPDIVVHGHEFRLEQVPEGDLAVFSIRHPVDRFVSGFISRQRKGRPRNNDEWTADEAIAYGNFHTANELAEALQHESEARRAQAVHAMRSIYHTRSFLSDWLGRPDQFFANKKRVLLILHQPDLDDDFIVLKRILAAPDAQLPHDPVGRHENPAEYDKSLSPRARANLMQWYAEDIPVYRAALQVRAQLLDFWNNWTGARELFRQPAADHIALREAASAMAPVAFHPRPSGLESDRSAPAGDRLVSAAAMPSLGAG